MAVGWDRPAPPADEAAIARVERELGFELPADYREFLRRQNGGKPEPNSYNRRVGVRYLYSAGPNDDEYVDDLEEAAMRSWADPMTDPPEDPMDRSLLPIGEEDLGNVICLKVGSEDYGAVYFWDPRARGVGRSVHTRDRQLRRVLRGPAAGRGGST
jgi:hypothetical protein